jgi:phosphoribosyl 1,2-cyclic phosphodiesterase
MPMRLCVLASGSSGNCIYVGSKSTHVLVDAGTSCHQISRRLALMGLDLAGITGVCVTHEHSDHTGALPVLYRKHAIPLYGNAGTVDAISAMNRKAGHLQWNVFTTGQPFSIGDLNLTPFSVPHDSYDPVGFIVTDGHTRIGIATDIGAGTSLVRERLRNCHVLVIEANHDEDLLRDAPRPWSLKQRIGGRQGHISNKQAAELVLQLAGPDTSTIFLSHLSSQCNRPDLAMDTVTSILGAAGLAHIAVKLTYPDRPSEILELR